MKLSYQTTINKIKPLIKSGHVPSFSQERYSSPYIFKNVNCFEHAIFNFSEQDLEKLNLTVSDRHTFSFCGVPDVDFVMKKEIITFVEDSGLKIEVDCDKEIQKNQWKIALYFAYSSFGDCTDFHFLIQDSSSKWTAKNGFSSYVEHYDFAPQKIGTARAGYTKEGQYIITNPFAKA